MKLRTNCVAAMALCRRDALIYRSYRGRLAAHVMSTFVPIATFYYISRFVAMHTTRNPSYFGYVVVGIMLLSSAEAGIAVAINLRSELLAGTFERLMCSPFGAVNAIIASTIFPTILQLCLSVILLCVANIIFAMHVTWTTVPLAAPVAIGGACLFNTLAVICAAATLVFKQTTAGFAYAVTALGLLGGVYFPDTLLPSWMHVITQNQPLTNLAELMRHYLIGYQLHTYWIIAVMRVAAALLVLMPLAYFVLYQAVEVARRRATVLEY
jgi:ABC-2 type transport system permease protein